VQDLGSPDAAAARILDKYLNKEFMSTRIGIRREGEIISAASRQGSDGKTYYDIEVRRWRWRAAAGHNSNRISSKISVQLLGSQAAHAQLAELWR
jgi:hypothetical protein